MSYNGGPYGYSGTYGYEPASGYNPFTDTDLKWFLDASFGLYEERTGASATTASTADGPVGTWQDRRGTAIYGTAASDARRPTLRTTGFNSRRSVQFDGVDDYLAFTSSLAATFKNVSYFYILVAIAPTAESVGADVVRVTTATSTIRANLALNRGNIAQRLSMQGRILDAAGAGTVDSNLAFENAETIVATGVFEPGNDSMSLRKNGSTLGTTTYDGSAAPTDNTDSSFIHLGAGTTTTLFYDGQVAGLMAFCRSTAFTAAELLARERYLGMLTGEVF